MQLHTDLRDAQPFRVCEDPAQLDGLPGKPELDAFEVGGGARAGPGRDHDVVDEDIHGSRPQITLVHRWDQALRRHRKIKQRVLRWCVTKGRGRI